LPDTDERFARHFEFKLASVLARLLRRRHWPRVRDSVVAMTSSQHIAGAILFAFMAGYVFRWLVAELIEVSKPR
jgi:hypothetical protein